MFSEVVFNDHLILATALVINESQIRTSAFEIAIEKIAEMKKASRFKT